MLGTNPLTSLKPKRYLYHYHRISNPLQCSILQQQPQNQQNQQKQDQSFASNNILMRPPPLLVVVGGGPAGVYGAIRAKSLCPQLEVLVLEKGQLLSKVKISGGGRCNVTTGLFSDPSLVAAEYPRGHKELRGSFFRTHGPKDTIMWFSQHGVELKTENDGRIFPESDNSSTIVDCLLTEARNAGVHLNTKANVRSVSLQDSLGFTVMFDHLEKRSEEIYANFILLATGSSRQGYELATKLGHTLVEPRPSLFTFKVSDSKLHELAGISFQKVQVELELEGLRKNKNFTQVGPMLVTHWGLSGPVILRLSAWAARELFASKYRGNLWTDFLPLMKLDEVEKTLAKYKMRFPKRKLSSGGPPELLLVRRFWQYLLVKMGMDIDELWASLPVATLKRIAFFIKRHPFSIGGKGEFKDEFVTAGGIPLVEVNLRTMESRICPDLYFAGEILDVDGVTGGFNFQNAWTGGYIAGTGIASKITSSV